MRSLLIILMLHATTASVGGLATAQSTTIVHDCPPPAPGAANRCIWIGANSTSVSTYMVTTTPETRCVFPDLCVTAPRPQVQPSGSVPVTLPASYGYVSFCSSEVNARLCTVSWSTDALLPTVDLDPTFVNPLVP